MYFLYSLSKLKKCIIFNLVLCSTILLENILPKNAPLMLMAHTKRPPNGQLIRTRISGINYISLHFNIIIKIYFPIKQQS